MGLSPLGNNPTLHENQIIMMLIGGYRNDFSHFTKSSL